MIKKLKNIILSDVLFTALKVILFFFVFKMNCLEYNVPNDNKNKFSGLSQNFRACG